MPRHFFSDSAPNTFTGTGYESDFIREVEKVTGHTGGLYLRRLNLRWGSKTKYARNFHFFADLIARLDTFCLIWFIVPRLVSKYYYELTT
jgi:hypothetical protein